MKLNFSKFISFNGGDESDSGTPKSTVAGTPAFTVGDQFLTVTQTGNKIYVRLDLSAHPNIRDYRYNQLKATVSQLAMSNINKEPLPDGRISGWIITEAPPPNVQELTADVDNSVSGGNDTIMIPNRYQDIVFDLPKGSDQVSIYATTEAGDVHFCGSQPYSFRG